MPASNEDFIKAAFAAGLSEDQVRSAVAERNARTTAPAPTAAPEDLSTGGLEGVARAILPRSFKANDEGAGLGRTALAGAGDALSGILRVPAALGRMADTKLGITGDHPQGFTESLNQINQGQDATGQKNMIAGIENDPATVPTMVVPLGKVAKGAGLLAKAGNGLLQGAKLGAVSAGIHQTDNAGQGKDVSLGDAATEVGANAALGGALPVLGEIAQAGGKKIINSLVRPSTKIEKFGYGAAGRAADQVGTNTADAIFDQGVDANSLSGMAKKVAARKDEIGQGMKDALAQGQAAGNKVDPYAAFDKVIKDIEANPDKFNGPLTDLETAKQNILDEMNTLHALKKVAPGQMDLEGINALKSRIGKMGNWESTKAGTATQELAKAVNRELDSHIDLAAPGIDKLNTDYQQMKSVGQALQDRLPVHNRNNAVGLSTLTALMGGPKVLLAQLASKSPMVARALYHGGGLLQNPNALRPIQLGIGGVMSGGQDQ